MTAREPARVLVTGSRDWADEQLVRRELARCWSEYGRIVVVHGACKTGADRQAAQWVADMVAADISGVTEEPHPADWKTHGKAAGPIRNKQLIGSGAIVCLAFIRCASPGASHTAGLAEAAGIETRRWNA